MIQQGLFGFLFCLLSMCVLVCHGRAQVPEPAQCLLSGTYNLTQQPVEGEDEGKCWRDCYAEPDCHMAVIVILLSGRKRCLLVNCLNQSRYSYTRDLSTQIRVYPKATIDNDQRYYYMTDAYGLADETLHCSELMSCSSCQSGIHRFFYNRTSYRCESFPSGCGSSRNSFETQEGCEALCNEKFRCYRPVQYGAGSSDMSMFFFNVLSYSCERFNFGGRGSNGNIFHTEEECEKLCGDIKAVLGWVFGVLVVLGVLVAICIFCICKRKSANRKQCLLVNCLNQGRYSYTRDPSTQIRVYPKTTIDNVHCSELMSCSSCQSGIHRFFYNRTSYRCESFPSGCGSSRNSFETQEGCEALCNEKFRCYRPVQYGAGSSDMSMFFFNVLSYSCERFNFGGHGSNGNIFHTEEECEKLCGDIKVLVVFILVIILGFMVVFYIYNRNQRRRTGRYRGLIAPHQHGHHID
ncbi:uncharacterized protein LOC128360007 [Scomber scombrus]|uniref:Uncharacterized protein LOC128360007 n=1 Tax=Scomber scombrus TaxID=13677 RepID=A0AAV1QC47_SCOSC